MNPAPVPGAAFWRDLKQACHVHVVRAGIESLCDFDVGGLRVSFGPRDRTRSTFVDVTVTGQDDQLLR